MVKLAQFQVKLTNLEHDVLVVKGLPDTANDVYFQGKIILAATEPTPFKRLSLKLTAHLLVDEVENLASGKRLIRYDKMLYDYVWDSDELTDELVKLLEAKLSNLASNPPAGMLLQLRNKSLGNLTTFGRNKSATHLSSFGLLTSLSRNSSSSTLSAMGKGQAMPLGQYEVPFLAVLPGLIPETVEGLPGGLVTYRIVALLDRPGKLGSHRVDAKKRFRVVRTLTTDAVELTDSVAVDNTWPNKIEYSLNVPSKAAAIGLGFPVLFNLVPLLKGLRLGTIRMELVEQYSYVSFQPPPYTAERVVCTKKIKNPIAEALEFEDNWEIDSFLKVPASLAKCTQDCDIELLLKVRHKIKFGICLINPDGHTSELRASLPVQLFISPFVTIQGQEGNLHCDDAEEVPEELLFSGQQVDEPRLSGIVAPPQYQNHIYDRLWLDVSPIESPVNLGSATPMRALSSDQVNNVFNMHQLDSAHLSDRLRKLNLVQENAGEEEDYFTFLAGSLSASTASPPRTPIHISRVNSLTNISTSGGELSRVPSYLEAMRLGSLTDLSPAYRPLFTMSPAIMTPTILRTSLSSKRPIVSPLVLEMSLSTSPSESLSRSHGSSLNLSFKRRGH